MRVLDIELKNYRKFKQFRCEFHPRFTLLAGENGSGKTSLIKGKGLNGGVFARAQAGAWSIWMTVFKDDAQVRQRLVQAFPGTRWNQA
jgi:predicted ATPase